MWCALRGWWRGRPGPWTVPGQQRPPGIRALASTASGTRDEYSHVVVGAGSAGCVLAGRLTEDPDRRVLLLEAGPKDLYAGSKRLLWKIHMPAALVANLCDDRYNWCYHTEPQAGLDGRVLYWPRGRVWGGSSSLNAMVYVRGHAEDYNRWHREGAAGWDYEHCLPYFRKAQSHELGASRYRGGEGPLHVSRGKTRHPLHRAFLEAAQQAGYPLTEDMNGFQQEGFGWMDMTIHKGQRWSAACAYLHPALSRPNLTAKARAFVSRVLFEGPRAVGVEYTWNGQSHRVSDLGPQQPHDGNGGRDPGVMPSGQESGSWPFRTGGEAAGSSGLKDCPGLCMSPAPYEEPAACACPSCRRADCVPSPPCQTWAASQEDPDNGPCGPSSFPQRQDCLHPVGIRPSARFM